ncbi:MAG: dTDP-glucose 4,6-dehydratase [Chlamydiae bacterium]|nr:dTDP-glucose 4,6-dehydratase [Chlamydiota bacterium]
MRVKPKKILVTGGAGFIGSAFIRCVLAHQDAIEGVINLDCLSYAADLSNLAPIENDPRYFFVKGDICNQELVQTIVKQHKIDTIVHFAAQTHVDRSIDSPLIFCITNVQGTLHLLEVVRKFPHIHFHHVSTDEVYGSLGLEGSFSEKSPILPNSPYAASKAASDHFVRAYAHTYGLSVTLSHCSNNYGPCQHMEKFIPHMLLCMHEHKTLPVYGRGENIRDWLYVDDHADAIWTILQKGELGQTYNIGGGFEAPNIEILDKLILMYCSKTLVQYENIKKLIRFVQDRPGHDYRYSIDASKIHQTLGWRPKHLFEDGIEKTVSWYLENKFKG